MNRDVFRYSGWLALTRTLSADPSHHGLRGILSDFLRDEGADECLALETTPHRRIGTWDIYSFGGSGRGSGSGIGSGIGSGSGIGIGSGSGRGIGSGSGSGSGSELSEPFREKPMELGKNYLVHCGDWHTFVGHVAEQLGPYTFKLIDVSKISETNNGDCWHEMAAGDERLRRAASYQHYTTPAVIPLTIAAFEWVGDLPQKFSTPEPTRARRR